MSDEYVITVTFKARTGLENALEKFLRSIINIAMQSSDCIVHDLHRNRSDSSVFMFYERWKNKEAHEEHIARPEVKEWRAKLNDFLDKPYEAFLWQKKVARSHGI